MAMDAGFLSQAEDGVVVSANIIAVVFSFAV
jgi:hypothetical protein